MGDIEVGGSKRRRAIVAETPLSWTLGREEHSCTDRYGMLPPRSSEGDQRFDMDEASRRGAARVLEQRLLRRFSHRPH